MINIDSYCICTWCTSSVCNCPCEGITPVVNPVTPEFGSSGSDTVAVPAVTVHAPVPTVGVLAAKVAVGLQMVWSIPASATVGN